MKSHFYIVVPVFNEAGNLERLFQAFKQLEAEYRDRYDVQFIMVDDGSSDGTPELAQTHKGNLDFVLLKHGINKGPGRAFGTAFEYLADHLKDDDWVATIEGDNTSRHELLRRMFRRATEEIYDVVFASPYMYGGGITNTSPLRIFLSNMANTFVKEFLGLHGLLTVSSFFRLYRATAIKQLQRYYGPQIIERKGFECMVEMVMKMVYLHITISEVPMVLDTNLRVGKSKMKIVKTMRGYFALWAYIRKWKSAVQGYQYSHRTA